MLAVVLFEMVSLLVRVVLVVEHVVGLTGAEHEVAGLVVHREVVQLHRAPGLHDRDRDHDRDLLGLDGEADGVGDVAVLRDPQQLVGPAGDGEGGGWKLVSLWRFW